MAYQVTQKDIDILKQKNKNQFIKVELLNQQMQTIDEMQGELIDYNLSIDAESDIRRTCNFTFYLKNKSYLVSQVSKIWFNRFIKLSYGIVHQRSQETLWYPLGIFVFTTNNFNYNETTQTVSCTCNDLMCNLTGLMDGDLVGALSTVILAGNDIRTSIISTINAVGWINKYIVQDIEKTIPFDLKFPTDVKVYDIISKIRDLYPAWESYFDIDGTFIYQQIPTCENDIVVLDESIFYGLVKDESSNNDLSKVKNLTEIWGKDGLHGICKEVSKEPTEQEKQADKTKYNCDNIVYTVNPESPFCADKIGDRKITLSSGEFEKIYTIELVLSRCKYENWTTTRLQDTVNLEMIYIPFLDVNQKISYTSKVTGITNQYIVNKISSSSLSGLMSVELMKFYPLYPNII